MTDPPADDLRLVLGEALATVAESAPATRLAETPALHDAFGAFRQRFPDRRGLVEGPADLLELLDLAASRQHSAWIAGPAESILPAVYAWVREHAASDGGSFRLVATRSGLVGTPPHGVPPMLDDLALMAGVPGMTVLVPSDAPSARAMTHWLPASSAPAYVRLTELPAPANAGPDWAFGQARVVREGADVGLIAIGSMVARAVAAAEELGRVGLSARVLDLASVKPVDLKAILRAARDTGALLTLEEHLVGNGVGTLVAGLTAENYPVPVRRLGIPDLPGPAAQGPAALDALGLSRERIVEETWELLRLKGKVQ